MAEEVEQKERLKYEAMWQFDSYRERSPGLRLLQDALTKMTPPEGASFVDFGCGTGRVSMALSELGYRVTAVDIADNACEEFAGPFVCASLWNLPDIGHHDFGFCADVMEHIPTEKVSQTIECLAKHAKTLYLQIANFHCHEGDKIGEHLHLTVKSAAWWKSALEQHVDIVHADIQPKHHIFVCKSRAF